jgi:cytochrome b6-f complex iron-sulfur subunit
MASFDMVLFCHYADNKRRLMHRRHFLKEAVSKIWVILGGLFVSFPAFSFMTFHKPGEKRVLFHRDEQPAPVLFKEGVFLVKREGGMIALSARCSHLGCTLRYNQRSRRFECPCHGSLFDMEGHWISGPAKKDLQQIPLTRGENGELSVILKL